MRGYSLLPLLCLFVLQIQAAEKQAIFAGGCFWCMEEAFEKIAGVSTVLAGFSGGHAEDPSYKEVVGGATGHYEAVRVHYDEQQVSYPQLLDVFWRNIDPLDGQGQFCDRGTSYRTAIFYLTEEQRLQAEQSLQELRTKHDFDQPIKTPIVAAGAFYPAEERHQDYARLNPIRYKYYKYSCRRPQRLKELWGATGTEKQVKPLY